MELGSDDVEPEQAIQEEDEPQRAPSQEEDELGLELDPYCPEGMVSIRDEQDEPVYWIDRFEIKLIGEELGNLDQGVAWPDGSTTSESESVEGVLPSTHFSWYQAVAICQNSGKYLCTTEEWVDACDGNYGEGGQKYPFGNDWDSDICAARFGGDPQVYESPQPTGAHTECVSPWGAYDMIGNIWEWTDPMLEDEQGRPLTHKIGASYYSGGGNLQCGNTPIGDHAPEFTGIIGTRCCVSPVYPD